MIYKDIEFVDAGDNGRAPIAAAVARRYIAELYLHVNVNSSGTMVSFVDTQDEAVLADVIKPYHIRLLKAGAITSQEINQLEGGQDIRKIVKTSLSIMSHRERQRVKTLSAQIGLTEYLDLQDHPRQTVARKEAELILALSDENYREVNGIYAPTGKKQEIRILGKFEDPLFASLEEHRKIADEIEQATIATLERLL